MTASPAGACAGSFETANTVGDGQCRTRGATSKGFSSPIFSGRKRSNFHQATTLASTWCVSLNGVQ
jgi:hypothetical protein